MDFVETAARELVGDPDQHFVRSEELWEQGMDSIKTLELRNTLSRAGARLKVSRMLGGPSIENIARMVVSAVEEHTAMDQPTAVSESPRPQEVDEEEEPLGVVASHLGAAFGGAVLASILIYIGWQLVG